MTTPRKPPNFPSTNDPLTPPRDPIPNPETEPVQDPQHPSNPEIEPH